MIVKRRGHWLDNICMIKDWDTGKKGYEIRKDRKDEIIWPKPKL